jgi:mRNA interferase MazF
VVTTRRRPPDTGDIAWLNFSPHQGHEQAGHRPALVLSPARYNRDTSMMICCPMTSHVKGYPFEVVVTLNPPSIILADQIKCLDWRARGATRRGRVSESVLAEVRAKLHALIGG